MQAESEDRVQMTICACVCARMRAYVCVQAAAEVIEQMTNQDIRPTARMLRCVHV